MNPADLTLPTISPTLATKTLAAPQLNAQKSVSRVDLEPIYTQLKAALGDGWADYKAAVNSFVFGNLNEAELSWVIQPLLSATTSPSTDLTRSSLSPLQLHNALVVSLTANVYRDPPTSEVAPWVVATNKPAAASKNAGGASGANDGAEELRMKRETMNLHTRDRRRIKALKDNNGQPVVTAVNDGLREMLEYRQELAVKEPTDIAPQSGGGLAKNWAHEVRRRYAQPLASETLEFPSQSDIQNRIESICAEQGLSNATQSAVQQRAEVVEQAAEVYLKEMLSNFVAHVRSNAEGCIQTSKYARQLRKEQSEAERGLVQRSAGGLLPVELEWQANRVPIDAEDMRTAVGLHDNFIRQDHFLRETISLSRQPDLDLGNAQANGIARMVGLINGDAGRNGRTVEADDTDGGAGNSELFDVLDDCLAVG
ncbi:hypothetical protein LTR56_005002 [Elasticomyces elasticus]|nr:hypothetical protein LTR22_015816 [Elasticomyces elasticus]KAK3652708.1 hypothetical protein LTR56_005002 [Elasticomyces elasticus]KAK4914638.1 hypothetical protein LTR49_017205 [Elasticomyces elasticus]KAK5754004.1 hypothetical protein LTS12_015970 [Elasticomyces elasticus]